MASSKNNSKKKKASAFSLLTDEEKRQKRVEAAAKAKKTKELKRAAQLGSANNDGPDVTLPALSSSTSTASTENMNHNILDPALRDSPALGPSHRGDRPHTVDSDESTQGAIDTGISLVNSLGSTSVPATIGSGINPTPAGDPFSTQTESIAQSDGVNANTVDSAIPRVIEQSNTTDEEQGGSENPNEQSGQLAIEANAALAQSQVIIAQLQSKLLQKFFGVLFKLSLTKSLLGQIQQLQMQMAASHGTSAQPTTAIGVMSAGSLNGNNPAPVVIIPKPHGEPGNGQTGYNLAEAMGLGNHPVAYRTILSDLRGATQKAGVQFDRTYKEQDLEVIGKTCQYMRGLHPYLTRERFPGDWAIKAMIRQFIKNRRKYLHAQEHLGSSSFPGGHPGPPPPPPAADLAA
ncbi:hypothetical protein FISHEDRAFT_69924 [Fistulina hepatica ATCC 64428]|uniref:Uncharacterized protein n=1 Tax=Fistulina hepatica ATCC 64428 TaxID=1128425 RepID=A0A0D7AL74_9AGAR|nr:hypothetical protein FISHEDRAFT_69924 [Fistulina hepatica ATCC 64428]